MPKSSTIEIYESNTYKRVFISYCSVALARLFSMSLSLCLSISYSPWLLAIWSVRILENGMGFSFNFCSFLLLVGCLLFQGHTSCSIHTIWNNSERRTIYSFVFFFLLNIKLDNSCETLKCVSFPQQQQWQKKWFRRHIMLQSFFCIASNQSITYK